MSTSTIGFPFAISVSLCAALASSVALTACKDPDGPNGSDASTTVDAGLGTGDVDAGMVGDGLPDGGADIVGTPITLSGLVAGESNREPLPHATVVLRTVEGAELARAQTGTDGRYAVTGPSRTLVFFEVEPIGDYLGLVRAEQTHDGDYEAYDAVLPGRAGAERVARAIGVTMDRALGVIVGGITPASRDRGGEGIALDADGEGAVPANITPEGGIQTNVLWPRCGSGAGEPCTSSDRSPNILYFNAHPGFVGVTPISPTGGTCELRFAVTRWLVRPDAYTNVDVDCRSGS